jgi:hypothetical protein
MEVARLWCSSNFIGLSYYIEEFDFSFYFLVTTQSYPIKSLILIDMFSGFFSFFFLSACFLSNWLMLI